MPKIIDLID